MTAHQSPHKNPQKTALESNSLHADVESLGVLVWRWNLQTDRVIFSDAWYALTGYSAEDISTGDEWFQNIHPDDVARVASSTTACTNGEIDFFEEEFTYRLADGSYHWIRSRGSISKYNVDGTPCEFFGFYTDINEQKLKELKLTELDIRWKQALGQVGVGVWDWDINTGETYFSSEWCRMLGLDPDKTTPTIETWRDIADPSDLANSDELIAAYIEGKTDSYECECRVRIANGEIKWVLDRGTIVERNADGSAKRLVGTHDDITKQKLQSLKIEEANRRLKETTRQVPGVVYQFQQWPNGRSCFPFVSDGVHAMYSMTPEELHDDASDIFEKIHPEDLDAVVNAINQSARELTRWTQDYRVKQSDDTYRWIRGITSTPEMQTDKSVVWYGYFQDINNLKEAEISQELQRAALLFQSTHDELTGLPNRRLFFERLNQRILEADRTTDKFAVLMLDLDMFKSVNDTLGHAVGDRVLKEFGDRMRGCSRGADTIARLGGDEFSIILSDSETIHSAISFVKKLVESFSHSLMLENHNLPLKTSIGIVMYPEHGGTAKELLAHADEAMYESKTLNAAFRVYSNDQKNELHDTAKISLEISSLANADAFNLVFQPIFDIRTSKVVGAEALARWHHPSLGDVSPAKFIPIVEKSKYCHAFAALVIDKALAQVKLWHECNHNIPISVNISPQAVLNPNFLDSVMQLLDTHCLRPSDLVLEITETADFQNFERAMNVLRDLAEFGIGISIDDFGTGYTSIRYLRDFPAKELKIDKSFIDKILLEKRYHSIVSSMVQLARGIGAKTVAEGIESKEILDALQTMGCDLAQGYHLGVPVDGEVFEQQFIGGNLAIDAEIGNESSTLLRA